MSDLIDRAQAMTELQTNAKRLTLAYEAHGEGRVEYSDIIIRLSDALDALRGLLSAEPRKKGKWIPQDHNKKTGYVTTTVYFYPKCSECGHSGDYTMNYCPNCGADMRGGK